MAEQGTRRASQGERRCWHCRQRVAHHRPLRSLIVVSSWQVPPCRSSHSGTGGRLIGGHPRPWTVLVARHRSIVPDAGALPPQGISLVSRQAPRDGHPPATPRLSQRVRRTGYLLTWDYETARVASPEHLREGPPVLPPTAERQE